MTITALRRWITARIPARARTPAPPGWVSVEEVHLRRIANYARAELAAAGRDMPAASDAELVEQWLNLVEQPRHGLPGFSGKPTWDQLREDMRGGDAA